MIMKVITISAFLATIAIVAVPAVSGHSLSLPDQFDIVNGIYNGLDTEDGTEQKISILCSHGFCDIRQQDVAFSTCTKLTGNRFGGGVGVARNISEDSLHDFRINLFCLQPGQIEIDVDNDTPTTTLTGDMISLPNSAIRRTGPGFMYFKVSNFGHREDDVIANGRYSGLDTEDGTHQFIDILCSGGYCDIILGDSSFSTCGKITGIFFWGGVGIARDIPEGSLGNFDIDLFCLQPGQLEFDFENDVPSAILSGNMTSIQDGIFRRTSTGFTYFRESTSDVNPFPDKESVRSRDNKESVRSKPLEKSHNVSKSSSLIGRYYGTTMTDGSFGGLDVICSDGFCDILLTDPGFSACVALTGVDRYATGLGIAKNVSKSSLDDFEIDIFCLQLGQLEFDIDNDTPADSIRGNFMVVQDGIIRRDDALYFYMNIYTGNVPDDNDSISKTSLANGRYYGTDTEDSSRQQLDILCIDNHCDINLGDLAFSTCVKLTGNLFWGGVAVARNVNEDSLDNFDLDLFCVQPGELEVDIDNATPLGSLTGDLMALEFDGLIKRTGPGFTYFKTNTE